jgi:putative ABC transport system substrate-binding protein
VRRRRFFALLGGAVALPALARAQQQTGKVYRIGYLGTGTIAPSLLEAFRQGLRELGWVEGRNVVIDYRFAEGQADWLPGLAEELVRLEADVIAASPTPAALAARDATRTIPIVGISFDNPVEHGLVASLARPGGNVTGLSYSVGPEIFGKDLELLREVIPAVRQVAVLSNSANPNHALMISNVETAARSLGLELVLFEARAADELDGVLAAMARARVEALFVFGDPLFGVHRARLAELTAQHRLPTMYTNRPHVEAGGLMCYGPSFPDLWRRAASYVDRILKGAKPADLPVEQPSKFELVINVRTAKTIGLEFPQSILMRADEVLD